MPADGSQARSSDSESEGTTDGRRTNADTRPATDGGGTAPIDRPVLEFLRSRLRATPQVAEAVVTDGEGRVELRVTLGESYYPASVDATLTVRWYTNDDFSVHYREDRSPSAWECRWDRHPNPHNSRDHFHPPPDAATPGADASWPDDHRGVLGLVMSRVEDRIHDSWE